jgi:hypothetical protein
MNLLGMALKKFDSQKYLIGQVLLGQKTMFYIYPSGITKFYSS